jgi:hypothetical protein
VVVVAGFHAVTDKYFGSHEIQQREEVLKTSTDRSFGLVLAACFGIFGALSVYNGGTRWPWWLALAVLFGAVAQIYPRVLAPLNRLWTRLGLLLFAVVSPLVLAIVFYLCIAPIGWILRLSGKDLLRLRFEPDAKSYWIAREPPGPPPASLKNQF